MDPRPQIALTPTASSKSVSQGTPSSAMAGAAPGEASPALLLVDERGLPNACHDTSERTARPRSPGRRALETRRSAAIRRSRTTSATRTSENAAATRWPATGFRLRARASLTGSWAPANMRATSERRWPPRHRTAPGRHPDEVCAPDAEPQYAVNSDHQRTASAAGLRAARPRRPASGLGPRRAHRPRRTP